MRNSRKYIFIVVVVIMVGYMLWDSFLQPGVNDLPGNFKEVTFYRNEQNTGPVVRIYAVTVADTLWNEMVAYGNYQPHTKYGNTKVYFFSNSSAAPTKLFEGDRNFSREFEDNCIARYEKDAMSQVSLVKYPFKKL